MATLEIKNIIFWQHWEFRIGNPNLTLSVTIVHQGFRKPGLKIQIVLYVPM